MLLFSVHCVLLSFPAMKHISPLSWHPWQPMSSLEPVCRVRPVTDRQAHSKLTFHLLTFLPCWLLILLTVHFLCPPHHKLTVLFFSLPLPLLYPPLSLCFHAPSFPPPLPCYSPSCSKLIHVKIIDDEEYEKNKNFFLELAEPRMVDMSLQKGAVLNLFSLSLSLSLSPSFLFSLGLSLLCPPPLPELSLCCMCATPIHPLPPSTFTQRHPSTLYLIAMLS